MLQCLRIISGGQTGVDRGALDAAIAAGLSHAGSCPAGRLAEDGIIDARYQLTETPDSNPAVRTWSNVQNSDATLILCPIKPEGGTLLTLNHAMALSRPCLVVDSFDARTPAIILDWLRSLDIETLNIAGPRESECAGIQFRAQSLLETVFGAVAHQS